MNNYTKLMLLGAMEGKKGLGLTATTTGAQTLTIESMTVITGETVTVNWGDGNSDIYTGTGARTHNYAGAGVYTVSITPPTAISKLYLSDNKITLNSANIKSAVNITDFKANNLKGGKFDSADVSAWRPTYFYLYSMPAGYAGTFNSADVSAWRPSEFRLYSMPAGYAGTFNSADVSAWRPSEFTLASMPAGYAGTFDSADVSAWRPINFTLASMPAGYAGTFDSADVSAWRPTYFYLYSMPAGYAGTFNSADVSAWRPTYFTLYSMPAGYTITTTSGGFSGWISTTNFRMDNNSLSQPKVDQILSDFWTGFSTRTASGGTINVGGTNSAPSGTLQAANPPDDRQGVCL